MRPAGRSRHARYPPEQREAIVLRSGADCSVPDVRAAFLIAPAIGPLIDEESLRTVDRPVAVRWGSADDNSPGPTNALLYAGRISGAEEVCVGEDVGHYVFVDGGEAGEPVRHRVAADAVAFFRRTLLG